MFLLHPNMCLVQYPRVLKTKHNVYVFTGRNTAKRNFPKCLNRTFHADKEVSRPFGSSSLFLPLLYDVVTATEFPEAQAESTKAPRKQWPTEPSQTVLRKLADASLLSSDSMTAGGLANESMEPPSLFSFISARNSTRL